MQPRFISLTDRGLPIIGNLPKTRHRQRSQTRNRLEQSVLHSRVLMQVNITRKESTAHYNSMKLNIKFTMEPGLAFLDMYMWKTYVRNSNEEPTLTVNHKEIHQKNVSIVVSKRAHPVRSPGTDLKRTRTQDKIEERWTTTSLPNTRQYSPDKTTSGEERSQNTPHNIWHITQ